MTCLILFSLPTTAVSIYEINHWEYLFDFTMGISVTIMQSIMAHYSLWIISKVFNYSLFERCIIL